MGQQPNPTSKKDLKAHYAQARTIVCEVCSKGSNDGYTLIAAGPKKDRHYFCPFHHPNTKFVR